MFAILRCMPTKTRGWRLDAAAFAHALVARRMTATEVAAISGVSQGHLSDLRAGRRCARASTARLITLALVEDPADADDLDASPLWVRS